MEELDLKELFEVFWSRRIYIALITLIFLLIGFVYSFAFVKPEYKSETSLLLVKQTNTNSETGVTASDLNLNQQLVSTYSELIRSSLVLTPVIENLGLEIEEEELKEAITVSSVKSTELINIRVVNESAKNAQIIASEVVNIFTEKVKEIYKIDNVNVISTAKVDEVPYNVNHIRDLAIFTFIGIVISSIYVLIANMLDTTVKSKEDIEKKLGLSALVEIPLCDFNDTKLVKKGGRR